METSDFQYKFLSGLIHDCFEHQIKNTDYLRFNMRFLDRVKRHLEDIGFLLLKKLGLVHCHFDMEKAKASLLAYTHNMDKLEYVYSLLRDDYSKNLFVELLKLRTLNTRHVRLPVNNKSFWRKYHSVDKKYLKEKNVIDTGRWILSIYEIEGSSGPIYLYSNSLGMLAFFLLEQYAYRKENEAICAKPGNIVIDGGSCFGGTALYLADKVGAQGKVYAFEFVEDNVEIFHKNMVLNKDLSDRIELVKKAISHISGKTVRYVPRGPSTSITSIKGLRGDVEEVVTITIDDFVAEQGISKVDFIKMDIEGSELNALIGAVETIRRFRPELAISVYHKDEDFCQIPLYINDLDLGYEFYIDHFSIHREESILFARSKF
jgi:FkbM family methyltransferase